MQLLESPIPPLTAAALRMIICKRLAPLDDHLQEAGPSGSSFVRGRALWTIIGNHEILTFALSGRSGLTPLRSA